MSEELSEQDLESIKKIIANSTLQSIEYFEVSAVKNEAAASDEQPGNLTIEVQQRYGETDFGVRLIRTGRR